MSRESSVGKGFGLGCGFIFGIVAAISILTVGCCAGVFELSNMVQRRAEAIRSSEPPAVKDFEAIPDKKTLKIKWPDGPPQIIEGPVLPRLREWELSEEERKVYEVAFRQEEKAAEALRVAREHLAGGAGSAAKQALGEIVNTHPGTETAVRAAVLLPEAEAVIAAERKREADEKKAAAVLSLAKDLIARGLKGAAKNRLEQIIKEYPRSKAADESRLLLKEF